MRLNDLLYVSIRQVLRHRRRYLGVVLAISLGVAGFISVITMSRDVKRNINRDLALIGGVTLIRLHWENAPFQKPQWFRDDTISDLRRLPGVDEVSPLAQTWSYSIQQGRKYPFMLLAVDESFWATRGFWPLKGRLFGPEEVDGRQREVVLGADLAQKIFGTQEVVGSLLEINHDLYRVAGVLGGLVDGGLSDAAFLPLTTAQDRIPGLSLTNRLYVRCFTWDDVAQVAAAIPGIVQAHQSPEHLRVEVFWEGLKRVRHVVWWIESFIYVAIGATLILGGLGIWNVMMAAVRSRTREIGLKKAMGAEDKDILAQFLSEALCLSLSAALVGVALGRLVMEITGFILGSHPPEELFLLCLVLGLLFAVGLGVGAGLYPSLMASRMEVVSAVRYE